jgi:hypothetical protein
MPDQDCYISSKFEHALNKPNLLSKVGYKTTFYDSPFLFPKNMNMNCIPSLHLTAAFLCAVQSGAMCA